MNKRKILGDRITAALNVAFEYGGIDGAPHKDYAIDQMVRALLGSEENYQKWVDSYENGEEYEWNTGIAP